MERKDEVFVLLKTLLEKAEYAIDKNQFSGELEDVKRSAKKLCLISKTIENYLKELEQL